MTNQKKFKEANSVVIFVDKGVAYIKEKPKNVKVVIVDKDCANFRGKPAISVCHCGFIIKNFKEF